MVFPLPFPVTGVEKVYYKSSMAYPLPSPVTGVEKVYYSSAMTYYSRPL